MSMVRWAVLLEDWARFHVDTARGTATRDLCREELQGALTLVLRAGARGWADRLEAGRRPDAARTAAIVDALLWTGLSHLPTGRAA